MLQAAFETQSGKVYQCNFCQIMPYILYLIGPLLQLQLNWSKLEGPVGFMGDTEAYMNEYLLQLHMTKVLWAYERKEFLWCCSIHVWKVDLIKPEKLIFLSEKGCLCHIFICRKADDFKANCRSRTTSDYCYV